MQLGPNERVHLMHIAENPTANKFTIQIVYIINIYLLTTYLKWALKELRSLLTLLSLFSDNNYSYPWWGLVYCVIVLLMCISRKIRLFLKIKDFQSSLILLEPTWKLGNLFCSYSKFVYFRLVFFWEYKSQNSFLLKTYEFSL